jgi:hypothetical protein
MKVIDVDSMPELEWPIEKWEDHHDQQPHSEGCEIHNMSI